MRKPSSAAISIRSAVSSSSLAMWMLSIDSIVRRRRLDVDKDVGDPGNVGPNRGPDSARNLMSVFDGEVWVDLEVEVDVILETSLAGAAFLDPECARHLQCAGLDFIEHRGRGHGVDQFPGRLAKHLQAKQDNEASDQDAAN